MCGCTHSDWIDVGVNEHNSRPFKTASDVNAEGASMEPNLNE